MKGSEALLRAMANEGGVIDGYRPEQWLGELHKAGLIEKVEATRWQLTDKAKTYLRGKGVIVE